MNEQTSSQFRNKTHQLMRYGLGVNEASREARSHWKSSSLTTLGTILLEHKQTKEWYGFNWKKSSICAYDDGDQNPTL